MIKNFLLPCLLFSSALGSKYGCVFNGDHLFHLYRKVADLYSKQNGNGPFLIPFQKSHNLLVKFVDKFYKKTPIVLLETVKERKSRPLAHFVFMALSWRLEREEMWEELSNPNFSLFFMRAKRLAGNIVTERYWTTSKEALFVLLSIQRQYLHHLNSHEDKFQEVRRWMREYEIIYDSFEPGNNDSLLHLFHYLQSMAIKCDGEILGSDPFGLSIKNSLKLLKLGLYHLNQYNWQAPDVLLFPPKLLYLTTIKITKRTMFFLLKNPKVYDSCYLSLFSPDFRRIKSIYEVQFKTKLRFTSGVLQTNSKFYRFLRECIEKKEKNIYNLEKRYFWFIETILLIASNLKDSNRAEIQSAYF